MSTCKYGCCPREVLDLFCGAGGAAMGLHQAWPHAHITGVDIKPQKHYPFEFAQADAMTFPLEGYDFIWASPPCQAYTPLRARHPDKEYPDLLAPTRARLLGQPAPWAMENVASAPMAYHVTLCGTMFSLRVYRHRRFETSEYLFQPEHPRHVRSTWSGRGQTQRKAHFLAGGFVCITGNVGTYCGPEGMGIDWMNSDELSQAIPPAYSKYIAQQLSGCFQ